MFDSTKAVLWQSATELWIEAYGTLASEVSNILNQYDDDRTVPDNVKVSLNTAIAVTEAAKTFDETMVGGSNGNVPSEN